MGASETLEEMDTLELSRPLVRSKLDGLKEWEVGRNAPQSARGDAAAGGAHDQLASLSQRSVLSGSLSARSTRSIVPLPPASKCPPLAWRLGDKRCLWRAQRHAHRLALLVEVPDQDEGPSFSLDELVELAKSVVSHPRTFNQRLIARLTWHLHRSLQSDFNDEGEDTFTAASLLEKVQMDRFVTRSHHPLDCERMTTMAVEKLRDKSAPWAVGREAVFKTHTDQWLTKNTVALPSLTRQQIDLRDKPRWY